MNLMDAKTINLYAGYTFEQPQLVTCTGCKEWIDKNLKLCDRGCGRRVVYSTCRFCLDYCQCGGILLETNPKWDYHQKGCKEHRRISYDELMAQKSGRS